MDATEQELLAQELQRRQAYLAEAQKLSHTGSFGWKPLSGEICWSDETFRIFELDPATKLTVDVILRYVHPADVPAVQEAIERASRDGAAFDLEHRLLMRDGRVKHVHVVARPVQNGSHDTEFVGAVTDITERKDAEQKLKEQERELRQMLDLVPQMVAIYGPNRERLYANRFMVDHLGISLDDWRQKSDGGEFFHHDDRERALGDFDRAVSGSSAYEFELRVRKHDGSYRWFLARFNPLRDEHGQITRWYAAATDIDDRKRVEETLRNENILLREEIDRSSMFEEIVGASPALQAVLSRVSKVARTDSTVLITGETGTGKELVARAVHKHSTRSERTFVSVNCAAIPQSLLASELFGHEKGAFTGALQRRLGRFELANGGTIFLDEIGELPNETQIALLRVLQEREFERVGGHERIWADVRVIAATNRDLEAAIATGTFRSDLYYRLNVFPVAVPPLRERKEDIPMLVEYFVDRYASKAGKKIRRISADLMDRLILYPWPGNIRELQNVIERSVILSETEDFSVDESWLSPSAVISTNGKQALAQQLESQEKEMIQAALAECKGRVSGPLGAATKLGLPPSTLESKIRSLNINKRHFAA